MSQVCPEFCDMPSTTKDILGCLLPTKQQVGSCAGVLPIASSLQQESARHAASMQTHQLLHPFAQSLTMSEDEVACEPSCNGEEMDLRSVFERGSCWGKFSVVRICYLFQNAQAASIGNIKHTCNSSSLPDQRHMHPIPKMEELYFVCAVHRCCATSMCVLMCLLCRLVTGSVQ